jgi:uncharacterized protein YndB with AHSA1/START domain
MKLTAKEDIEAPIAFVFATLTDFDTWERSAMRRGADVLRTDKLPEAGPGMGWKVDFDYRGKRRNLSLTVADWTLGQRLQIAVSSLPAEGDAVIELTEMGPKRTRMQVVSNIRPRTLAAKLVVQSLRLAKAKVKAKFDQRIGQVAAEIEDRFRAKSRS